jgi:hypothetical protein
MEATHPSKMSADFQWTTQQYTSIEGSLHNLNILYKPDSVQARGKTLAYAAED